MNAAADLLMVGRVLVSLVAVVALAAVVARLARRATVRGDGVGLRVIDRVGLSREASLAVVAVADRALVVGVTAGGVTLLTELDPSVLQDPEPPAGAADRPSHAYEPPLPARRAGLQRRGTGSVLDPRTWRQAIDALRDLTTRRG